MKYVIIGNSAAAIGCVEGIRKYDSGGEILLVSKEPYATYSRPLISYYLAGQVDARHMGYRPASFYKTHRVTTLLGSEVVGLDTKDKTVRLSDSRELAYDKLLIATGGVPFVPPIEGSDAEGVMTFTTWDDAKRLKRLVPRLKKVVILGGGLIGIKAMEGLQAHGTDITVVELMDRILGLVLDKTATGFLERKLKEEGVHLVKETTIKKIHKDNADRAVGVTLENGRELATDQVIIAIGVRPNIGLVKDSPVKTNRGIVVDYFMRTSEADVYAAGDVAEAVDILYHEPRVIPILPNAYKQGKVAGSSMTGNETEYPGGMVMNSVEVGGIPAISAGIMNPPDDEGYEVKRLLDRKNAVYRKMVIKDNRLVGFILIGAIDRAGIYTGLIREGVDISPFKNHLTDLDFGVICFPKDLRTYKISNVYM
ncbi:MAG: FAD-dependent oxidoreductase [Nitrospiraceae bacterium]|nr:FAD-dependent oxidoreductase [Nitrospiraceae bacterium]